MQIVLVTETSNVSVSDLYRLAPVLERNGRHCATAWDVTVPAVDVILRREALPKGAHPIIFMDASGDPTELAAHYWDVFRQGPAARVFTEYASGFNWGDNSVVEAASHELVEMLIDPQVNRWADHPDPEFPGVQVAVEIADPVQTHYLLEQGGTRWQVANFVTPFWFHAGLAQEPMRLEAFRAGGGRVDWAGELTHPGEIGPKGYAIVRQFVGGTWTTQARNRAGNLVVHSPAKGRNNPLSRTKIRGAIA
jgi:hypothetical protein